MAVEEVNAMYGFVMHGAREHTEGYPVELVREPKAGRLSILARNEGGCNITAVDLWDVVEWLRFGPLEAREAYGFTIGPPADDEHNPR